MKLLQFIVLQSHPGGFFQKVRSFGRFLIRGFREALRCSRKPSEALGLSEAPQKLCRGFQKTLQELSRRFRKLSETLQKLARALRGSPKPLQKFTRSSQTLSSNSPKALQASSPGSRGLSASHQRLSRASPEILAGSPSLSRNSPRLSRGSHKLSKGGRGLSSRDSPEALAGFQKHSRILEMLSQVL